MQHPAYPDQNSEQIRRNKLENARQSIYKGGVMSWLDAINHL